MYEAFYNLSGRPFQLMPDPRLLFSSRDHSRALSYLLYGLDRREGFVVISGDVGTGKTLLVQTLLQEIKHRDIAIARIALANLDASSVVPAVAAALGVSTRDRDRLKLLDALIATLRKKRRDGALIIVDEAQTASPEALEELRMIANLEDEGRALIQIFLVGQTELRARLRDSSMTHLRQRVVAAHHLEPLASDEISEYVEHRLERVGWQHDPEIDPAVYDRVYAWTAGVPRRINRLMDRLLLYGHLEERHQLGVDDLEQIVAESEPELSDIQTPSEKHGGNEMANGGQTPIAHRDLDDIDTRLRHIEQALCKAFGVGRVESILASNQADASDRALIAMQLRLDRIERSCRALLRDEGLDNGDRSIEASAAPDASPAGRSQ